MKVQFTQTFSRSAGLILLALATTHFLGNQGGIVVQPLDPIFAVSTRHLFWSLAGIEALLGVVCFSVKSSHLASGLVAWFASNCVLYRLCLLWFGAPDVRAYYDTMSYAFGLSARTVDVGLTLAMGYLLVGSLIVLFWRWKANRVPQSAGSPDAASPQLKPQSSH
ncbi:MAG: hypothetical protein IH623_24005 [Verrucomicrobia bacterium]|nr:hypothetical protein [Verrucomicrobiota bacterium]